ncbi:MAG TPA: zinc-dependent metalloprotease [Jatrophihabitans sp.]|nr:zinc-dependent metalloprotease [Jatrophihabitans sp.]
MTSLIDWSVAERTGRMLAPVPPAVTPAEAQAVVAELRQAADRAAGLVAELTELAEPAITADTVVVDRPGWVSANTASMSAVMDPLVEKLTATRPVGKVAMRIGGRITGGQAGAILAFLSGKVLGQFEFFSVDRGQLLLVAPNIVTVERALRLNPSDFRLWVCLHEVTHRVQFTAVPWLRKHMLDEVSALSESVDTDPDVLRQRLRNAVSELAKLTRGDSDSAGLIAALSSPESRVVLDRLTGFMSLVEGHAEFVMNAVPGSVIPSQPEIERRFAARRRRGGNPLDRLLRSLLGLDAKTRQYTQGSQFVRAVVDQVGLAGFNAIWTSPDTLPSKAEITAPADWVRRVHG